MTHTYTLQQRIFTLQMALAGLSIVLLLQVSSKFTSSPYMGNTLPMPSSAGQGSVHYAAPSPTVKAGTSVKPLTPAEKRAAKRKERMQLNQMRLRMQNLQNQLP